MKFKSLLLLIITLFYVDVTSLRADNGSSYSVTDYGVTSGDRLNTEALQSLIDLVNSKGGGTLIFPKGEYLTGTLEMKSDVNLYLERGATILGSVDPSNYRALDMVGKPKVGERDDVSQLALFVAYQADNFTISGDGCIDGQGRALALNIDSLHHAGVVIDPKYNYRRMRPNETARPKLFRFSMCKGVDILNLSIRNSACWGLSFELCKDLKIEGIDLLNRAYWNNDGMDITDCEDVKILNCNVNSADDGICLKSYYPGYCNRNVEIRGCTIRSSASAIKFGTASFGGFKSVTIDNIDIYDTFRSAIAIESVDGGDIENIEVSNIRAKNTGNAIFIRLGHRAGEKPGTVNGVHIHNIDIEVPFGVPDENYDMRGPAVSFFHNPIPSSIVGIPGHNVKNVVIENIKITLPGRSSKGMAYVPISRLNQVPEQVDEYPEFSMFGELPSWGFYVRHAEGVTFKNIELVLKDSEFRPAFVFDQVEGVKLDNISLPEQGVKQFIYRECSDIDADKNLR